MDNKSFVPVKSYIDTPSTGATVLILSVVSLSAAQLLLAVKLVPLYFKLVEIGITNKYGLWIVISSEVLLLAAVILLIVKRRGDKLFFMAGISFLLSFFISRDVLSQSLLAYSMFFLAVASSILGWLASRPKLHNRAPAYLRDDEATRKIYWSYKSIPELKEIESSEAKQLYKKASAESSRRAPYWKHMLLAGLVAGAGNVLFGDLGLLIGASIYGVWFAQDGVARTRVVLREMGYPKKSDVQ